MNTSNPDDKSAQSDSAQNPKSEEQASTPGIHFDEVKKKLEERLAELGKQMDTLKDLLSKAAHDAKHSLEQQIDKLQKDHSEEFERLSKLRAAGEAGLSTLGARLDKLVEDVTAAITSALGFAKPAETKADSGDKADGGTKADDAPKPTAAATAEDNKAPAEPISTDAAQYYANAAQQSSEAAQHPASPAPSAASPAQRPSTQSPARQAQDAAAPVAQHADSAPKQDTAAQQPADATKNPSNNNQ